MVYFFLHISYSNVTMTDQLMWLVIWSLDDNMLQTRLILLQIYYNLQSSTVLNRKISSPPAIGFGNYNVPDVLIW